MMTNNNLDIFESGLPKEKEGSISEADLGRVQENLKKAGQVWRQIQQQKIKDSKVAFVLEQIVKSIDNDLLLSLILNFYERKKENIYNLFLIIFPFIKDRIDFQVYKNLGELNLENIGEITSISDFVEFFKKNDKLEGISQQEKVEFIFEIVKYYNVGGILEALKGKEVKERESYLNRLKESIREEIGEVLEKVA